MNIKLALAIVGCMLTCGCASADKMFIYPHFRIVETDYVEERCDRVKTLDDGTPYNAIQHRIRACYSNDDRTVYIKRGDRDALVHELCHAEGLSADTCGKYYH